MPELPEVETIRRQLDPQLSSRTLTTADSHPSPKFTPAHEAVGATITGTHRRGKYLILSLSGDRELIIHLGMTGVLRITPQETDDPYVRARWQMDDSRWFEFRDVRRFGRLRVVPAGEYKTIATLHQLGPEPFDPAFTAEHLHRALTASKRRIKTQLLSQKPVAGVGNIYADEALWMAKVYPAARRITKPKAAALRDAIESVLQAGVDNGGTTLRDYRTAEGEEGENQHHLNCYGRAGEACPRCTTELQSEVWDARTTTFCPACQR